jgi:hypothetical protein
MNEEKTAMAVAQVQMAYHLIITNLFHCLHCKDVLPLSDAVASLESMDNQLPAEMPAVTRGILRTMIGSLQKLAEEAPPPNPGAPPAPMRPDLRLIPGGRNK